MYGNPLQPCPRLILHLSAWASTGPATSDPTVSMMDIVLYTLPSLCGSTMVLIMDRMKMPKAPPSV